MRSLKIEVTPSILAADFRFLERELKRVEECGADRIHCDIMDGVFVPNISFGPMIVEAVKKSVSIPLDVHLMIADPVKYIDLFCDAGSDTLIVHAESCTDLRSVLEKIKSRNVRTGVTVNPDKKIDLFLPYLDIIDQVLIMTVYAGFGGQKFIPEMLDKIKAVSGEIQKTPNIIDLQVDGGITDRTASQCAKCGVNVFVSGSFIFGSSDYHDAIGAIRDAAK